MLNSGKKPADANYVAHRSVCIRGRGCELRARPGHPSLPCGAPAGPGVASPGSPGVDAQAQLPTREPARLRPALRRVGRGLEGRGRWGWGRASAATAGPGAETAAEAHGGSHGRVPGCRRHGDLTRLARCVRRAPVPPLRQGSHALSSHTATLGRGDRGWGAGGPHFLLSCAVNSRKEKRILFYVR